MGHRKREQTQIHTQMKVCVLCFPPAGHMMAWEQKEERTDEEHHDEEDVSVL